MTSNTSDGKELNEKVSDPVYTEVPTNLRNYVNKRVKILTDNKKEHIGIVYTIDPISQSVVLIQTENDKKDKLKIIMGCNTSDITIIGEEDEVPELFIVNLLPDNELLEKKNLVKRKLADNLISVTESNGILYLDNYLQIQPPYNAESCISDNCIILTRIQNIINDIDISTVNHETRE